MYRNAGITGKQGTVVRRKPRFNPILGTFGASLLCLQQAPHDVIAMPAGHTNHYAPAWAQPGAEDLQPPLPDILAHYRRAGIFVALD